MLRRFSCSQRPVAVRPAGSKVVSDKPVGTRLSHMLQCTNAASKRSETIRDDWVMEKGRIDIDDVPRDYRCPWDRRGAR